MASSEEQPRKTFQLPKSVLDEHARVLDMYVCMVLSAVRKEDWEDKQNEANGPQTWHYTPSSQGTSIFKK